jgi:hypothetical protein
MSQRTFPPSFWNSDYYVHHHGFLGQHQQQQLHQQHAQQQYDPYDAYVSAAAADPWQSYMYHQHHRATSDMYSQASRQYSSLLHLQSSAIARQAHQQGRQVAAALGKAPSDSWSAAAEGFSAATAAAGHPHYPMTGTPF